MTLFIQKYFYHFILVAIGLLWLSVLMGLLDISNQTLIYPDAGDYNLSATNLYWYFRGHCYRPMLMAAIYGFPLLFGASDFDLYGIAIYINVFLWLATILILFELLQTYVSKKIAFLISLCFVFFVSNALFNFHLLAETPFLFFLISGIFASGFAQKPRPEMKKKNFSGNPIFEGWYADPEGTIYNNEYWVYPTLSDVYGEYTPIDENSLTPRQKLTINKDYLKQTYLDAFSSKDLVTWKKHPRILDIKDISWAAFAIWAPATIHANNKYFLFFGANDIQNEKEYGGIGVAVSDRPEGPFKDALGKPLIDKFHNGAQPIDQFVFRDDDGQFYMYYGGWRHCNVVKLSVDLLSTIPFPDGTMFKEITPENYVEGYEMTTESPSQPESNSSTFSSSDLVAFVLVAGAAGAVFLGFTRRRKM